MNLIDSDLGCHLMCDVCEGEIMILDDLTDTGCCAACGLAYVFDNADQIASVSA